MCPTTCLKLVLNKVLILHTCLHLVPRATLYQPTTVYQPTMEASICVMTVSGRAGYCLSGRSMCEDHMLERLPRATLYESTKEASICFMTVLWG
jgi:hypothetical protein